MTLKYLAVLGLSLVLLGAAFPAQASDCSRFMGYANMAREQARNADQYLDQGKNGVAKAELEDAVHSRNMAVRFGSGRECFNGVGKSHWTALEVHLTYLYDWWLYVGSSEHGAYVKYLKGELSKMQRTLASDRKSYTAMDARHMGKDIADMKSLIDASSRLFGI